MKRVWIRTIGLTLLLAVAGQAEDRFVEWRGKDGQGHSEAKNLPVKWTETEGIAWKMSIPGHGWSTPVVAGGKVWVTTGIDTAASKEERERRSRLTTNSQPLNISKHVSLRAICLDLKTGEILKNIEVLSEEDPQMIHRTNSYATPTPIIDGDRLYCHYGPLGIAALDMNSEKVIWSNRTLRVKHENGPGSSPVLWKDHLLVHCDGIDVQYIVAIDKNSGKTVWKTERTGALHDNPQMRKSYATSIVAQVNGNFQVVSPAADWVYGYDPTSGKELWKLNYGQLGFSNAARPIAGNGLVFVTTGYMKAALLALDITTSQGKQQASVKWRFDRQVPNVSSPLLVGDELYLASDNGIVTCLDSRTGTVHWVQRMGSRFWASPLYADGKIYFFDHEGATTVIQPGRKYEELGKNQLSGTLYASPSAVDGSLLIRTDKALYCIEK